MQNDPHPQEKKMIYIDTELLNFWLVGNTLKSSLPLSHNHLGSAYENIMVQFKISFSP